VWTSRPGDASPDGRPTGRQHLLAIALLAIIALGVLYPAVAPVLSRRDYGTFAFWKVPNRINYCGRRYYDGGPQQGSPSSLESQHSAKDAHWTFLSWTFGGHSIYADVNPVSAQYSVCTMFLYIPIGGGKWDLFA
jgi:hypothetical protein